MTDAVWGTILTAAIAAAVAFLFSQISDALRTRRDFKHRWDRDLYERSQEFVAAARKLAHLAGSDVLAPDDISTAHANVRVTCNQLLVLADAELAQSALQVQREAHAVVRAVAGKADLRPSADSPTERFMKSLQPFYSNLRRQLGLQQNVATRLPD